MLYINRRFTYLLIYLRDAVVPDLQLVDKVSQMSSSVHSRAFFIAGLQAWNQLSTSHHQLDCVTSFKRHLKTKLFTETYYASQ